MAFSQPAGAADEINANTICGKWMTSEKDLIVQISLEGSSYKAKILWMDTKGSKKPLNEWTDDKNPNPALRSRKVIGINALKDMHYSADDHTWSGGTIYDFRSGKEYNASARIDKNGLLQVRGFWHIRLLGKTLTFIRQG